HVGTNAVPHLLKWISHETPQWRTDLGDYLSGSPWPLSAQPIVDLVMDRRSEALAFKAAYCFRDLGTNAHIAFPQLQAIATTPNNGRSSGFAIMALEASGSSAIPNLLAVVGGPNSPYQRTAINSVFGLISTNRDQKSRWSPITERLNDPDPIIRKGVTNFSKLIRPELLTNGIPR
ncbi:MAG: hypothetical protein H7X97_04315, partial [Opitutaceae bacterium]|nr:hypothetical protein [Verrucomicrobiales bacterium]